MKSRLGKYNSTIIVLGFSLIFSQIAISHAANYFYDDLNRLIRVENEDGTNILYGYDEVGNRLSRVVGPDTAPPNNPSAPSLTNGATNVPYATPTDITWTGGDPNGDTVTYRVYLDTNSHPSTLVSSGSSASYHMQNLSCGTTYYWSITSVDRYGAITEGPVWHFTTARGPSVKNMRSGNTYSTLTAAYGSAVEGDEIRCQGVAITDNFTANNPNNISVTITGGYDCTFTSSPDKTTLVGAPVISRGTVTLRDFIISN